MESERDQTTFPTHTENHIAFRGRKSTERGGNFKFVDDGSLENLGQPTWLIDEILPADALCVLYGLPGTAKSFIGLDWAMSIANGDEWLGRKVKRGSVLYVAAEGARGYTQRVAAWKSKKGIEGSAGVQFLCEPVRLTSHQEVERLINSVETAGISPTLIVFDTFARCFDGDDNSARDVSLLVSAVDRIRVATGATILLIHHSRKDDSSFRGSGALHGAVDMMVHVAKSDGLVNIKCEKMKDGREFDAILMKLYPFEGSAILAPADESASFASGATHQHGVLALDALRIGPMKYSEWLQQSVLRGVPEGSFDRVRKNLLKSGGVVQGIDKRYHLSPTSTSITGHFPTVMEDGTDAHFAPLAVHAA
jgi:hypothetical protein